MGTSGDLSWLGNKVALPDVIEFGSEDVATNSKRHNATLHSAAFSTMSVWLSIDINSETGFQYQFLKLK